PAVPGAHHRAGIQAPCESCTRRELRLRGITLLGRMSIDAGEDQPALEIQAGYLTVQRTGDLAIEADREMVIAFLQAGFVLISQPEVDGEAWRQTKVVLDVAGVVVDEHVHRRRDGNRPARRNAEKNAGHRAAGVRACHVRIGPLRKGLREAELTARLPLVVRVDRDLAEIAADLDVVTAEQLRVAAAQIVGVRQTVDDVPIAENRASASALRTRVPETL